MLIEAYGQAFRRAVKPIMHRRPIRGLVITKFGDLFLTYHPERYSYRLT